MIISASRRTDIPALYAPWLRNRLRAGWCEVVHPFRRTQVFRVSLRPEDVDAIVFWTRNARPMFPFLDELDALGYRYVFLWTLVAYPPAVDPGSPPPTTAVRAFRELADRIGPDRIAWRYDPILWGGSLGGDHHRRMFETLARSLSGSVRRCTISFFDPYRKTQGRIRSLRDSGWDVRPPEPDERRAIAKFIADCASAYGIHASTCCEEDVYRDCGLAPGRCIDPQWLNDLFGLRLAPDRDPGQRPLCGCAVSRDIGAYDTCVLGCAYCYATSSFERAAAYRRSHDPASPRLG